jgi:maltose alpha-D-glucosyltransferase / alpha-amylase
MNDAAPTTVRLRRHAADQSADPLWYKDAIIYQLHLKSFYDSNDDGVGDFQGLLAKLDYIAKLGVTAVWLLPFYPSPRLDDGYDIADYRGVHTDYGTLSDVKKFINAAHSLGIRVITELVLNHTSDQHPWFQRARRAKPGSVHRDFYVWSDNDQAYSDTRIIFVDTERSNWTWDPVAGAFYWHRFYSHQPDLNFDNPRVMREVLAVLRYWAELGVDGLRLDAVPYLVEREGTNNENLPETHSVLKRIRAELDAHFPDRMLLAEANQWPEDTKDYFGDADECHMAFHFPLMPRMYMAIAREDRFPITDILRQTPDIPETCQWAIFLRNHDELTLEMVTQSERDFLWETYAADRRARLNLGIRRRLAPLLERDRRRIELMHNLLLSMPGTPVIYYGDEIGMGDNIHLGDRDGVRTPMQWSPDRNGGFSRIPDPSRLVLPVIMDPLYGYEAVNVEAQAADPYSLLMWMRRTIAIRRQYQAFGRGSFKLLYPKNRKMLAYLREHDSTTILCVANLARTPQAVELDLSDYVGRVPIELDGGSVFPPIGQLTYLLTLPPFGFYWFLLAEESEWPSSHTPAPEPMPDYQTIVIRNDLAQGLGLACRTIERESLPSYLPKRRWYSLKDQLASSIQLNVVGVLPGPDLLLTEIETTTPAGTQRWFLPLGVAWEDRSPAPLPTQLALARVRRGARIGLLTDAFSLAEFSESIVSCLMSAREIQGEQGTIRFEPTGKMSELELQSPYEVTWLSAEQSNSSLIIGSDVMLKIFRRVTDGPHPEAEMGRYLTDHGYQNVAPLLGEMRRIGSDGVSHTLAIAQGFVRNQGDAWTWTLDLLVRGLTDLSASEESTNALADIQEDYKSFAALLGQRVAEMHAVLARESDDPAFAPAPLDEEAAASWAGAAEAQLDMALDALAAPDVAVDASHREFLATVKPDLTRRLRQIAKDSVGADCIRIHGDLHLGQVLVANGDVFLIDFEGEPSKSSDERRRKSSRWRDVAGVLRSFDYAAAVVQRKSMASHAHLSPEQVQEYLEAFKEGAARAFLAGYDQTMNPGEQTAPDHGLLTLFLLEKAAYEVVYEAGNRPAWIDVPTLGLVSIAEQVVAEGASA